jgi:uncharacterized protein
MLDLLLIMALGFLGSFGHCVGMCGPLSIAFSLTQTQATKPTVGQQFRFHLLLNLGRILSYTLVGAGIGAVGSVVVAGGQLAGIGSPLRQGFSVVTGYLLILMGFAQIRPQWQLRLPFLHPFRLQRLHERLNAILEKNAHSSPHQSHHLTPIFLGLIWGLIPCGFLYVAQLQAATTGNLGQGALILLAFGCGTLPMMLGVGLSTTWVSANRRSQLFRLGGWVTLLMGGLTLFRSGTHMSDLTGHGALLALMLTLVARPIGRLWPLLLQYRRFLGVSAFLLAIVHTLHMAQHTFNWNPAVIEFMLPPQRWALWAGITALLLMVPAVCTSFDTMVARLGHFWRTLHSLVLPAFAFGILHTLWLGSHYLGGLERTTTQWIAVAGLTGLACGVLLIRQRWIWKLLSLESLYVPESKAK